MSTATRAVPESLAGFLSSPKQCLINGQWTAAADGQTFDVINPSNAEVIAQVASGQSADIDAAVKAARQAFESGPWSKLTASARGQLLWKIGELIEQNND